MVRTIELNAKEWTNQLDFYDALLAAIGAPEWNGRGVAALMDAMIWDGLSSVQPPYVVRIAGVATLPAEVRGEIDLIKRILVETPQEHRELKGCDVNVQMETDV